MFDFIKKKNRIIKKVSAQEAANMQNASDDTTVLVEQSVEGTEVWLVQWEARYGSYSGDYRHAVKSFLNKNDAEQFASNLRDAQKLLQYTEGINIRISKAE